MDFKSIGITIGTAIILGLGASGARAGDPAAGEAVFRKCQACHEVGPEAKSKVGPLLTGVIGRVAGKIDDFAYSSALLTAAEGDALIWTPENLDKFLEKPRDFLPGTKMAFAGLRKPEERADLIAYLETFAE